MHASVSRGAVPARNTPTHETLGWGRQGARRTWAVPRTPVAPEASLRIVRSISIVPSSSTFGHRAAAHDGRADDHRRAEDRVEHEDLAARRPAVDHRRQVALAHDPGDHRAGQALGAGVLVVGEAREVHLRRLDEAPHRLQRDVGALLGQLVAELDLDRRAIVTRPAGSSASRRWRPARSSASVERHPVDDEHHRPRAPGLGVDVADLDRRRAAGRRRASGGATRSTCRRRCRGPTRSRGSRRAASAAALMCVGNDVDAWKSGCAGSMKRGSVSPHVTAHSSMRSWSTTRSISWNTVPTHCSDAAPSMSTSAMSVPHTSRPAGPSPGRPSSRSSSANSVAHSPMRLTMCESLPPMPR